MPSGPAPREVRRPIVVFTLVVLAIFAVVVALSLWVTPWLGALVAMLAVAVTFGWYERAYADAARRTRERLAAMALLSRSTGADFAFLRDHLGVSDSDLSKQMSSLESVGYVKINKVGRGRGASTAYQITKAGRAAYLQHRAALEQILR
jgi:DNA-binding MarR family transcriptional regulator